MSLWGGSIRSPRRCCSRWRSCRCSASAGSPGLPLGLAASDITLHDTYYVVAHFHYLVAPGTVFALFAGIYHWFPAVTGRSLSERLGKWHFWLSFFLMNKIFLPMFFVGLAGVNRRMYDAGLQFALAQPYQCLQRHMTVVGDRSGHRADPVPDGSPTAWRQPAALREPIATRLLVVRTPWPHRPPWLLTAWLDDVLRLAALGLRAAAGRQQRMGRARSGCGRWRSAVAPRWRSPPRARGGARRCGPSRAALIGAAQSCGSPRCTTATFEPDRRPSRTWSSRRGSRSRVACSPGRRYVCGLGGWSAWSSGALPARAAALRPVWGSLSLIWFVRLSAFSLA